jgi:multiple sugar transport system substrate-binding protein
MQKIICLAMTLFLLVSCQARPSTHTVSFMVFGDPAERDAYRTLVAAFEDSYPEIKIQMTHVPAMRDYRARLATEFAAGTPPDVMLLNYRRFVHFAARGVLTPVGPYLRDSDLIQPGDFYPVALEAFTWNEELICLPQNISSLVVYYNQDLFDAAGLPYPADDWHWDDFLATAQALTVDGDGDGRPEQYGLGVEPSLLRLTPFVWQNGGVIVDNEERPNRLTLARPPTLAALQWFSELQTVHGVAPDRAAEASLDSESRFVAGTTAMFLNSRRGVPTYRQIDRFVWDVAPLPRGRQAAGILHSDAYCLSSAAADQRAAWTFIEFANSPAGQTIIAQSGRTAPSLTAVAESDAFLNPDLLPSRSYVFLETIPLLRRTPLISTWEEIERVAGLEIERAFYGEISAAEAANLAFMRTEEYFLLGQMQMRE